MITLQTDLDALRARFFTSFSSTDPQVLWMGKPTTNPDESKPYCRFSVEPVASRQIEGGSRKSYQQIGYASLTVTIPKGVGTAVGYDLRDRFANLYRDWRSDDHALVIGGYDPRGIQTFSDSITENSTSIIIKCRVYWESFRSPAVVPAQASLNLSVATNSQYAALF